MICAGLIGWSLRFAGIEHATLPAVLIGMLVALFVPARGACAVPKRERGAERPGPQA